MMLNQINDGLNVKMLLNYEILSSVFILEL